MNIIAALLFAFAAAVWAYLGYGALIGNDIGTVWTGLACVIVALHMVKAFFEAVIKLTEK